ncbi:MAG: hypothetical protein P9L98_00445 [Candidatus Kaelpia imicola]|nr:hypothetical protein [Candidatus Kaelpia imicola]
MKNKKIFLVLMAVILFSSYPCDARRTKDASSQAEGRLLQLIQTVTQREQEVIIAEREDFSNGVLRFLHFKEHILILLNSKAVGLLSDYVLEEESFTEEETEIIDSDIFPYLEGNGFEVIFPFELEVLTVSHWDDIATKPVYIAGLDSYDLPIQIKIIEWFHNLGFEGGVVYDPMCSSGALLVS